MRKMMSLMLDFSRDVSNKNEFIIAWRRTFNQENCIWDFGTNETKSINVFKSLTELLTKNKIDLKRVVAIMIDNTNDMTSKDNGLTTLLKTVDSGLFTTTCICHSLSLVLVNTLKIIYKNNYEKNDV